MDNLFVIHKLKELLAIDSPLGMHREMAYWWNWEDRVGPWCL